MAWSDAARRAALEARRLHLAQKGKGQLTLYRGTNPGSTQRISTGNAQWDGYLFAASSLRSALPYGRQITVLKAKPTAKILFEGTKVFNSVAKGISRKTNLLEFSSAVARAAAKSGYDAVHFKRQSDVGTAIINPTKFKSRTVKGKK